MKDSELLLYTGGAALALLALAEREVIVDVVTRGKRLTTSTLGVNGCIATPPSALAVTAAVAAGRPVSVDALSMARMIRSEGAAAGRVRAHVALNDLAELRWASLSYLLTYSTAAWARGLYGQQYSARYRAAAGGGETWDRALAAINPTTGNPVVVQSQSRRYATSRDCYLGDLALAEQVIRDHAQGIDPTGGAVKFVDRSSMGVQAGSGSYASLVARWAADGLRPFHVPGYTDDLVVFRRVG